MMRKKWIRKAVCMCPMLFAVSGILMHSSAFACTDFQLKAKDNTVVNGRSMEFGLYLNSEIVIHPRGQTRTSIAPNGKQGLSWKSKYGILGVSALGMDIIVDGFNEQGLSMGALWFPGAKYQDVLAKEAAYAIAIEDVGAWILGNFATVAEVKDALKGVRIWGHEVPQIQGEPPLHLSLHDLQGNSLVIEFINGKVITYDNPAGTLTNYPPFDWHMINLQNYINLTAFDRGSINLRGTILGPTGKGSGLLGIPGDWTPPSRFIRTTILKQFATTPNNASEAVNLAAHLLNAVDIPHGDIRENANSNEGDYTQWCVIKDLTNKVLYFRSYRDLTLRAVDLAKVDLGPNGIKLALSMEIGEPIVDMTDQLHEVMPSVSNEQAKTSSAQYHFRK